MKHGGQPTTQELMKTPEFYEEMLLLTAQELIAQLMSDQEVSKADLARALNKTKAHVTSLLSDGRNLTLKSLANVCYHLGAEVKLDTQPLSHTISGESIYYKHSQEGAAFAAPYFLDPGYHTYLH